MGDRAKTMSSSSSEQPGSRKWGSQGKEMGLPSLPGVSSHNSKDMETLIKAAPLCLASPSPYSPPNLLLPLPLPVDPLTLHSAPSPPSPQLLQLSAGLCFMSSFGLQSRPLIWLAGIIRSSNAVRAPFIPKHAEARRLADDLLLFYCPSGAGRAVSRE